MHKNKPAAAAKNRHPARAHPLQRAARLKKRTSWDAAECDSIARRLERLRERLLEFEQVCRRQIGSAQPTYREGARNLAHYLALRQTELPEVQAQLAAMGISSLGRSESHVLANLDKVIGILTRLAGREWESRKSTEPAGMSQSASALEVHCNALLGREPSMRSTRIMVTLPSAETLDRALVKELVEAGMNVARINCAHDDAAQWQHMAAEVRRAARAARRPVKILMDLAGPKLRTGEPGEGAVVLKVRPSRNDIGRVVEPGTIRLYSRKNQNTGDPDGDEPSVGVDEGWLEMLIAGDVIKFVDGRGSKRQLYVAKAGPTEAIARCEKTCYFVPETKLALHQSKRVHISSVSGLPTKASRLLLNEGQTMLVTRSGSHQRKSQRPTIPCSLPAIFSQVATGERILFDDARIEGKIGRVHREQFEVRIARVDSAPAKLGGDKGINLPDSDLSLPAVTAKDREDLKAIAKIADIVGISFVQRAADIQVVRKRLAKLGRKDMPLILKIETARAFDNMPGLLFELMKGAGGGVMIARGDLAAECGYERLADLQEELLWVTEAAHLPVVWATEVLDSLAKTGRATRAEITDAAMGERAECVMLNKGPKIVDAVRALSRILKRAQGRQLKRRPLLRKGAAWGPPNRAKSSRRDAR